MSEIFVADTQSYNFYFADKKIISIFAARNNCWVRITVSTRDSQSRNRSSILLPSTRKQWTAFPAVRFRTGYHLSHYREKGLPDPLCRLRLQKMTQWTAFPAVRFRTGYHQSHYREKDLPDPEPDRARLRDTKAAKTDAELPGNKRMR